MVENLNEENVMEATGPAESLCFDCSPAVPCFNECCRDLNLVLTPYDILRLKRNLGLTSRQFIEAHAWRHDGPETGLPVITLKMNAANHYRCPFVSAEGCRVYADRPGACRLYPLARMAVLSRETGAVTEHLAVIREPHCRGFAQTQCRTVAEWLDRQGVREYNFYNDLFMEIIALKTRLYPGPLDDRLKEIFEMACYDLDHFRSEIVNNGLLDKIHPPDDLPATLLGDEDELLKFGMRWFRHAAFGVRLFPENKTARGD